MKFLPILLAAVVAVHAGSNDPGSAALDFLEKVRQRKLDLEPGGDTALSPETADGKRTEIKKRLERMAKDLGTDPLEVGEIKQDENFAAVLIRKSSGFDPGRLRIFPVALVKRDEKWAVAPVPASFENAGAGYAIALRKRLDSLENWMLREQVIDLENLRAQSTGQLRQNIEKHLSANEVRGSTAKQAGDAFLAACERRDLPAVLGWLGGLSDKLPDDWAGRLKSASEALGSGQMAAGPWRLLTAPEVLRVPVVATESKVISSVTVVCLDPFGGGSGGPRFDPIPIDLSRSPDRLWQVNLPSDFLLPPSDPAKSADGSASLAFAGQWSALNPPLPQPSAELARDAWIAGLHAPTMKSLLGVTTLPAGQERARETCLEVAKSWAAYHDPASVKHALALDFQAGERSACGVFEVFSTRDPASAKVLPVYFEKSSDGWRWVPAPDRAIAEPFRDWIATGEARWSASWQEILLQRSPVLGKLDASQPPSKDDARACVESWLKACQQSDMASAISQTTRFGDPKSAPALLQNLGFEITGFRRLMATPTITGIYQGKLWTAVGVKIEQPNGKASYPLYPILQTPEGPRLLAELSISASRARDFLNRTAFSDLGKMGSPEAAEELRTLYAEHQDTVDQLKATPAH